MIAVFGLSGFVLGAILLVASLAVAIIATIGHWLLLLAAVGVLIVGCLVVVLAFAGG